MEAVLENALVERYPDYKTSGENWFGDIPVHWNMEKLKHIAAFVNRGTTPDYVEISNYRVINQAIFSKGYFDFRNVKYTKEKNIHSIKLQNARLQKKDIVLASTGGGVLGKVAFFDLDEDNCFADSHVTIIRFNNEYYCPKFYYYLLSINFDLINAVLAQGSTNQTELQRDWLINFFFPVTLLSEQTAIAQFLDHKTELIDKAIAIKEKQIELLKERRQILIHRAVTRGLNPNVKLKDSGVEWIGEIPEHWEVKKLKYLLAERNERSETGEEPLLMVSQTHGLVVRADYHEKAEVAQSNVGNKIVYENDLVFNKLKAHLGVFFKSTIKFPGIVSPDYAVYYPIGNLKDMKYLELLFRHPAYIGEFICRATGIVEGLIRLYTGDLFSISVPVPPAEEQNDILSYIGEMTSNIYKLINNKDAEIEKLKEYKSSLINAAVTGKIKVS